MSKLDKTLTFYPAYCYSTSPTYFIWVKLTCNDVHHVLRTRTDTNNSHHQSSTGNPLYFYLNHPIQFIQLTGVVVAIEDFHPHIFLFTLDDSSGSTIDVVYRKPKPNPTDQNGPATINAATTLNADAAEPSLLPLLSTLTIGTPVLAKGTLAPFRNSLQLNLLRLATLTPVQELRLVSARTTFLLSTLSKPWTVSPHTQSRLLAKSTGDRHDETQRAVRARKRREMKQRREREDAEAIVKEWQQEEKIRAREAEVARQEGVDVMKRTEKKGEGKELRDVA